VNDTGLGDVSEFFNDPSKPQIDPQTGQPVQKQEKPDPEMAKVQAGIQQKQAELAMQQQAGAAKLALQQQEMNLKLSLMQQQGAQQQQIDAQKALMQNQLDQAKAQAEAALAERQQQLDAMLGMQKIAAQERSQARSAAMSAHVQKMRAGREAGRMTDLTDRQRVERAERAKRAIEEFVEPAVGHVCDTFERRLKEVAQRSRGRRTRSRRSPTSSALPKRFTATSWPSSTTAPSREARSSGLRNTKR
jgi:hypothetical protein